jgi:AP-4 complex subunit mu-1
MVVHQFFVLSRRGDNIIFKDYRGDAIPGMGDIFFRKVRFWDEGGDAPPCFLEGGITYCYIKQSGLHFVATTQVNASPSLLLELVGRLMSIIKDYCGVLTEESIRKNFLLIYELLDECIDFGFPQATSTADLKAHIQNEPAAVNLGGTIIPQIQGVNKKSNFKASTAARKPVAVSEKQMKKAENEIFCDILENLSVTFSNTGQVINSSVEGCIQMKSYLSGNPELKLALNEDLVIGKGGQYGSVVLDDCNFHDCVQLAEFENDRVLTFLPPEGEFTVINYRTTGDFKIPFRVSPFIEEVSETQIDLTMKVTAEMPENNYGANVMVKIPCPKSTLGCSFNAEVRQQGQQAEYRPAQKEIAWVVKKFTGGQQFSIRARITLDRGAGGTASARREIGPLSMTFEVPMYNVSNLQVRYLRIPEHARNASYKYKRWVRYVTQSQSYVCRV